MGIRTAFRLTAAAGDRQARQPYPDLANAAEIPVPWSGSNSIPLASFEPDPITAYWLTHQIDRHLAMTVAAVAKGRGLLTGMVARFPLITMQGLNAMPQQPITTMQPEIGRSRNVTMTWTVDALIFYGRAFWRIVQRNPVDGRPIRFEWIPEWAATTDQYGELISGYGKPIAIGDSIRIDGPHEGILNFAAERIREAISIDLAAAKSSDNPVPAIELHQTGGDPLPDIEIQKLVAAWTRARHTGGVGYTNESIQLVTHGLPAEQLLIDGRNWCALNIARAMGLPGWAIDASVTGTSLTYSNVPSRSRELIDYSLAPYMAAIEGRLSLDDVNPHGQWVRFDTTDLLRGDFATRMSAYAVAIDAGVYTAEECRAMETAATLEESTAHA
jgi:Phage portal protein